MVNLFTLKQKSNIIGKEINSLEKELYNKEKEEKITNKLFNLGLDNYNIDQIILAEKCIKENYPDIVLSEINNPKELLEILFARPFNEEEKSSFLYYLGNHKNIYGHNILDMKPIKLPAFSLPKFSKLKVLGIFTVLTVLLTVAVPVVSIVALFCTGFYFVISSYKS